MAGTVHIGTVAHWYSTTVAQCLSGRVDIGTVAQWTLAGTRSDKPQITKQQQAGAAVAVRRERTRLQDERKRNRHHRSWSNLTDSTG